MPGPDDFAGTFDNLSPQEKAGSRQEGDLPAKAVKADVAPTSVINVDVAPIMLHSAHRGSDFLTEPISEYRDILAPGDFVPIQALIPGWIGPDLPRPKLLSTTRSATGCRSTSGRIVLSAGSMKPTEIGRAART